MNKPRFLLSKKIVISQYNKIKEFSDLVSYSLKTNPEIGKVLQETDSFFSIHSLKELSLIKDKSKIWFFIQSQEKEELDTLFDNNVENYVVDNKKDLTLLLNYIQEKNKKINLLLRMRLKEHTIHTGKHYVFGLFSKDINELIPILKENKNINLLGIHFHRKTQNISEWSLKEELTDCLTEDTFNKINLVNIGGGIPYKYKNFRVEVLDYIFSQIKELKEFLNKKNIKLISEPGRFIAAPSIKLETEIINIYDNNIVVNASVWNAAMDTFVANIRLLVENELEEGNSYTIKGLTPDSMDIFRYQVYLKDPKIGDKIIFLNAGAYNFNTDFCGLEKIETKVVD